MADRHLCADHTHTPVPPANALEIRCNPAPILSVFAALIVHSELRSVHPGFPVAFIF